MKCSVCCTNEATVVKKEGTAFQVLCDECADKEVKGESDENNKAKCYDN